MIQILIIDDNEWIIKGTQAFIMKVKLPEKISIAAFTDADRLLKYCEAAKGVDIVYVDIDLGEGKMNGMDLAKRIREIYRNVLVIYMTAYDHFKDDLLQAEPFRFLKKPFLDDERFTSILKAAYDRILEIRKTQTVETELFDYRYNGIIKRVNLNLVMYFTSRHRQVIVKLSSQEEDLFYAKLDDVEADVGRMCDYFVRTNQSYLVNKNYITEMGCQFVIVNKQKINLSTGYRETVFCIINQ